MDTKYHVSGKNEIGYSTFQQEITVISKHDENQLNLNRTGSKYISYMEWGKKLIDHRSPLKYGHGPDIFDKSSKAATIHMYLRIS